MLCLEVVLAICLVSMVCASMVESAESQKEKVYVDADRSECHADLEPLMGVCMYGPDRDTSSGWHKAWKTIGLKHVRGPGLTGVKKTEGNDPPASPDEYDFSEVGEAMRAFRYMEAANLLNIGGTPRCLSSNPDAEKENEDHYSQYAPKDYALWEQYVEATTRYMLQEWNCKGAYYEVWNEPEDFTWYWKGKPGSDDVLADFVEMYIHTARAIKRVDPTAKVGGPTTAHWDSAAGGAHTWGLPQFLRAITEHRAAHPDEIELVDFITWHDYTWISHCPSLSDGAAFVDKTLDELGWTERPEYCITEWNLGFAQWAEKHSLFEFASHVASNILEQANPHTGRLSRMFLYVFDHDDDPKTPLISGWRSEEGPDAVKLLPSAAVFQMLDALNSGDIVQCETASPLTALATRQSERVSVMCTNYSAEPRKTELVVKGLGGADGELPCHLRRVDETHSADGKGLEAGESIKVKTTGGTATLAVEMPAYSTVLAVFG